ncbi:thiamine phosphate synthase [bacterium]|nr:thiamine phosphate synthase [bacterium]
MKHSLSPWADVVAGCFPEVNETERSDDVPESTDAVQVPSEYQVELRERLPLNRAEIFRVIDAAANRSREGLRVVEDFVRFTQNDGFLSRELKQLRHDLQQTLTHFAPEELAAARDTQGDVGVSIETATEYQRNDVYDVLIAAFKRTQEALRTLEEYTKILAGGVAHHFERLRYQSYTIEKAVLQTLRARERLASQLLYVLLTESQCPAGVGHVLRGAYEAGVQMFQIREKSMCDRELVEHCRRIRRWTQEAGALLIINDRPDIAAIVGADGVHVGQEELSVADVRRIVGPNMLIGVSTHAIDQARQAVLDGADYLGVGPTFPTPTKTFESFPGLDYIAEVAAEIELPWFAIGGITPETVPQAKRSGAARIAVSSAVSRAESPVEVCTELLWALQDTVPAPASPSNPSK